MREKIGKTIRKYLDVPEVQENQRKLSAFKTLCRLYPKRYSVKQEWAGGHLWMELWHEYKSAGKLRIERVETIRMQTIEDWEKESNAPF